jgi:hypothetical protein
VTWPGNPDRPVVRLPLGRLARTLLVACHILLITSTAGGDAALVRAKYLAVDNLLWLTIYYDGFTYKFKI